VCALDGFCCQGSWDASCVAEVEQFGCGSCGMGGVGGVAGAGGSAGEGGSGGIDAVCEAVSSACGACLCAACVDTLSACVDDARCLAILACTERTSCQGLGCYAPGTCRGVIDASGGPLSLSMQRLGAMLGCSISSGCPCN